MRRYAFFLVMMLAPVMAYAQSESQEFKREAPPIEDSINGVVSAILPDFGLMQKTRSTYLEGYGGVFILEVALERASNPFFSPGTPAEVKRTMARRQKELKERVSDLLKQKLGDLKSVKDSGSIAVVVYLLNTNPAYVPDLPSQTVFTAKKQESGIDVTIHEF